MTTIVSYSYFRFAAKSLPENSRPIITCCVTAGKCDILVLGVQSCSDTLVISRLVILLRSGRWISSFYSGPFTYTSEASVQLPGMQSRVSDPIDAQKTRKAFPWQGMNWWVAITFIRSRYKYVDYISLILFSFSVTDMQIRNLLPIFQKFLGSYLICRHLDVSATTSNSFNILSEIAL